MGNLLDRFYTLSEEERQYKALFESGRISVDHIILPSQVQGQARLEEKIVLSSSYYSRFAGESVIAIKHPVYMPRYLHSHRFVELTYVVSGSLEETIEGQDLAAGAGDAVIIMPGFYHSIWTGDEKTLAVNLILDNSFFSALEARFDIGMEKRSYAIYSGLHLEDLLEDILRQDVLDDRFSLLGKELAVESIILSLMRQGRLVAEGGIGERKEVFRIMGYLEENFHKVTLTEFADDFGITEQYASRLIKDKTGSSFSEIVKKLRMEEAAALLKKPQLSSKEISYAVGYSSSEHFSRTFKSYFGLSPDAWRKEHASVQMEHLLKRN